MAESASRLGLTVREIPATVEVIDQQTIRDQGYRTVSEVAQGAVGVTSGDNPAEPPASFSMRGFTNSQINTLYNGIKIGPQNMTSRVMDTANLESVEFLKGPASLLSGEGAAGGAVNYVTKQPNHRTDPERGVLFLRLTEFVPRFVRFRRQHQRSGAGLSLRRQPFVAQWFYRRHQHQNLERLRPTELSRFR